MIALGDSRLQGDRMTTAIRSLPEEIRDHVARGQAALPPLPAVAVRIQSLVRDPERADPRAIASLVHADPAIAAVILRMANSVAYAGLRQITDLAQAVSRLGLHRVGSIVTATAVKDYFESKDPSRQRIFRALWNHSVATALGARCLAGTEGGGAEDAFLAGLLHDIGKLLVLEAIQTLEKRGAPSTTPAVVEELMDLLHAELGNRCLTSWKLPAWTASVALHHHDARPAASETLLLRVQVANAIARKIGAHPAPDPALVLRDVPAVALLGLTDDGLASVSAAVESELASLRALL